MVVVVVQSLSHVRLFVTPWTAVCQASLSFTMSQSLLKLMPIVSVHSFQSPHPLSPSSPPTIFVNSFLSNYAIRFLVGTHPC